MKRCGGKLRTCLDLGVSLGPWGPTVLVPCYSVCKSGLSRLAHSFARDEAASILLGLRTPGVRFFFK